MNEWISVKDRLPNSSGRYLCCIKTNPGPSLDKLLFTPDLHKLDPSIFDDRRPGWLDIDCFGEPWEIRDVTHWMPLPELPEEAGEN